VAFDLIAELEAIVDIFQREHVEYAVCGGLALGLHGLPRATMDIDILLPASQLADAMRLAKSLGFDIRQRLGKMDPGTGNLLSLDLLVVAPDLEGVWASRISMASQDRTFTIVSREGLATMKRIAGRPQDLLDIAKLEGTSDDD
jgi:hypothetical protein